MHGNSVGEQNANVLTPILGRQLTIPSSGPGPTGVTIVELLGPSLSANHRACWSATPRETSSQLSVTHSSVSVCISILGA